ncbi:MAG: hypothetical protein C0507_04100 [Cyanobacteria bacterium PR.3.49]|nr:hypothetical protein [Cyanobacteria bacterium PR.3.49]
MQICQSITLAPSNKRFYSRRKSNQEFNLLSTAICAAVLTLLMGTVSFADEKSAQSVLSKVPPQSTAAVSSLKKRAQSGALTYRLAKFHTTRHEFRQAALLWAQLANAKPDAYAEAYLGWCHLQMGDKQKAFQHINKSIQINPKSIEGYRYLGYYLMGEGRVPEAVKAFRTSMAYDPHHKCNCGDLEKLVLSKSKKRGARG